MTEVAPITPPATPPPATPPGATPPPEEPKLLAGKYKDEKALEEGYLNLVKKIGEGGKVVDDPMAALKEANVRLDELTTNFATNGKLSDDQYAALRKAGMGKGVADAFVNSHVQAARLVESQKRHFADKIDTLCGGPGKWDQVKAFAATRMTKAELDNLNAQLEDPRFAENAVRGLLHMHEKAVGAGQAAPLIAGAAPPSTARGYTTHKEFLAAIQSVQRAGGKVDPATAARLRATPENVKRGIA